MNFYRIGGIVLAVVGAIFLGIAYSSSTSPLDQITSTFTGRFTSQTLLYAIGGIVAVSTGLLLTVRGPRVARST